MATLSPTLPSISMWTCPCPMGWCCVPTSICLASSLRHNGGDKSRASCTDGVRRDRPGRTRAEAVREEQKLVHIGGPAPCYGRRDRPSEGQCQWRASLPAAATDRATRQTLVPSPNGDEAGPAIVRDIGQFRGVVGQRHQSTTRCIFVHLIPPMESPALGRRASTGVGWPLPMQQWYAWSRKSRNPLRLGHTRCHCHLWRQPGDRPTST